MAIYKDLNSYYGTSSDNNSILLEDDAAILNAYLNLLNTNKDADGISERAFRPNLGGQLLYLLEEPMDDITTFQIQNTLIDIGAQLSRATVNTSLTTVEADIENQEYIITIALINSLTGNLITSTFVMPKINS